VLVHAPSLPNGFVGKHGFMTEPADRHPREDDRNEEIDESPVPDPTETNGDAEDDPGAD
jgi:hypothetical protein